MSCRLRRTRALGGRRTSTGDISQRGSQHLVALARGCERCQQTGLTTSASNTPAVLATVDATN
jgi:hypothetical protein